MAPDFLILDVLRQPPYVFSPKYYGIPASDKEQYRMLIRLLYNNVPPIKLRMFLEYVATQIRDGNDAHISIQFILEDASTQAAGVYKLEHIDVTPYIAFRLVTTTLIRIERFKRRNLI